METLEELTEAIDGTTNVKSVSYEVSEGLWVVTYLNGLDDHVETNELIEFLYNA